MFEDAELYLNDVSERLTKLEQQYHALKDWCGVATKKFERREERESGAESRLDRLEQELQTIKVTITGLMNAVCRAQATAESKGERQ